MKREFFLQDDRSNKFWTIEVAGPVVVTGHGRVGATPRETRTEHSSAEAAMAAAERDIRAKLRKGYTEGSLADIPAYSGRLPPKLVRINLDDDLASRVGKTRDGRQFFVTTPFAQRIGADPGGSWVARYLFDEFGRFLDARIEPSPPTDSEEQALLDAMVEELGEHRLCDIRVAPFSVEAFGRSFGLVFDPGEEDDDDDSVWVTAEPGDYMAFYPPWDGDYDT